MRSSRVLAGETALQILIGTAGEEDMKRKIERLLTATKFAEFEMRESERPDLLKKVKELRKELMRYRLINWAWVSSVQGASNLSKEALEELKEVQRVILKIEGIRLGLIEMILQVQAENREIPPEVGV